jgi:hypothetical protein
MPLLSLGKWNCSGIQNPEVRIEESGLQMGGAYAFWVPEKIVRVDILNSDSCPLIFKIFARPRMRICPGGCLHSGTLAGRKSPARDSVRTRMPACPFNGAIYKGERSSHLYVSLCQKLEIKRFHTLRVDLADALT